MEMRKRGLVVKMDFKKRTKAAMNQPQQKKLKDPTGAKRQKRYRVKWKHDNEKKEQNIKKCKDYRERIILKRFDEKVDGEHKKRERERKAAYRRKQYEEKTKKEEKETQGKEDHQSTLELSNQKVRSKEKEPNNEKITNLNRTLKSRLLTNKSIHSTN